MMQSLPGHQATTWHSVLSTSTLLEAPILHYTDPSKCYIVYTDASDDACGAQMSQEHDGQEPPAAFSSPHLQRHPMEMEHYRTGSLWHLLCCNKVELLYTRI